MSMDEYLNLPYRLILSRDDDGDWVASVDELEGCVAHGATKKEALERLDEMQRLWIQESLGAGQSIPRPLAEEPLPSGRWLQRVPRSLHRNLSRLAKVEGVSLNQLVTTILSEHLGMTAGAISKPSVPVVKSQSPKTERVLIRDNTAWRLLEPLDDADVIVTGRLTDPDYRALDRLETTWASTEDHDKAHTRS